MKITLSNDLTLQIITREDNRKAQDESIIAEVIINDCYWLKRMKSLKPKVLIDIGGHIGCWGIYAKSLFPDAKLIAVEPNKESYGLYQINAKENGLTNYEIINAAVEYNKDKKFLVQGVASTGGCWNVSKDKVGHICSRQDMRVIDQNIQMITIEEILRDIHKVDISKWDSEGAELRAFRNMLPETRNKFEILVGEYHTEQNAHSLKKELNVLFPNHHIKINHSPKIGWFRMIREK